MPKGAGLPPALLPPGAQTREFTVSALDGKPFAFHPKSAAKPTLVIFWSIFCEPCKEEFPMYGPLLGRYTPRDLDAVTVNMDGPGMAKAAERFAKLNGVSAKVLIDRKEANRFAAAGAYGVTGTPSLFLIDEAGKVRWSHAGRISAEKIEAEIQRILRP